MYLIVFNLGDLFTNRKYLNIAIKLIVSKFYISIKKEENYEIFT